MVNDMATAAELVRWAQSQIGVKESPAGSNIVKYWDFYKDHCGVNYQGQPWCAAFVACGMTTIGQWDFTSDEGRFRYTPSLVNWAKQNGQWLDRSEVCQPGDLVLFANKGTACHVGIVEKRISSSQIQTIEGNTSVTSNDNGGAVMRRTRSYGAVGSNWYILGFVRSNWSNSAGSTPNVPSETPSTPTPSPSTSTSSSNWIARLQTECNAQGFSSQKVDGIAGPKTLAGCPTLGKNSKGTITKIMQQRLIDLGYPCGSYGADGINGSKTQEAIKKFQRDKGLTVDGIVGKNTWRKLLGL